MISKCNTNPRLYYLLHSPPRPPTRRMGRPNTGNNVDVPFFGGCRSCAS